MPQQNNLFNVQELYKLLEEGQVRALKNQIKTFGLERVVNGIFTMSDFQSKKIFTQYILENYTLKKLGKENVKRLALLQADNSSEPNLAFLVSLLNSKNKDNLAKNLVRANNPSFLTPELAEQLLSNPVFVCQLSEHIKGKNVSRKNRILPIVNAVDNFDSLEADANAFAVQYAEKEITALLEALNKGRGTEQETLFKNAIIKAALQQGKLSVDVFNKYSDLEAIELIEILHRTNQLTYLVKTFLNTTTLNKVKDLFQDKQSGLLTEEFANALLNNLDTVKLLSQKVSNGHNKKVSREDRIIRVINTASNDVFEAAAENFVSNASKQEIKVLLTAIKEKGLNTVKEKAFTKFVVLNALQQEKISAKDFSAHEALLSDEEIIFALQADAANLSAMVKTFLLENQPNRIKSLFQKNPLFLTTDLANRMLLDVACVKALAQHVSHFWGGGALGAQSDVSREFRIVKVIEQASPEVYSQAIENLAKEYTAEQMKAMFTALTKDRWFKSKSREVQAPTANTSLDDATILTPSDNEFDISDTDLELMLDNDNAHNLITFYRQLFEEAVQTEKFEDLIKQKFVAKYGNVEDLVGSASYKMALVLLKHFREEFNDTQISQLTNKLTSDETLSKLSSDDILWILNNAYGKCNEIIDVLCQKLKNLNADDNSKLRDKLLLALEQFYSRHLKDVKKIPDNLRLSALKNPLLINTLTNDEVHKLLKKLTTTNKVAFLQWYNSNNKNLSFDFKDKINIAIGKLVKERALSGAFPALRRWMIPSEVRFEVLRNEDLVAGYSENEVKTLLEVLNQEFSQSLVKYMESLSEDEQNQLRSAIEGVAQANDLKNIAPALLTHLLLNDEYVLKTDAEYLKNIFISMSDKSGFVSELDVQNNKLEKVIQIVVDYYNGASPKNDKEALKLINNTALFKRLDDEAKKNVYRALSGNAFLRLIQERDLFLGDWYPLLLQVLRDRAVGSIQSDNDLRKYILAAEDSELLLEFSEDEQSQIFDLINDKDSVINAIAKYDNSSISFMDDEIFNDADSIPEADQVCKYRRKLVKRYLQEDVTRLKLMLAKKYTHVPKFYTALVLSDVTLMQALHKKATDFQAKFWGKNRKVRGDILQTATSTQRCEAYQLLHTVAHEDYLARQPQAEVNLADMNDFRGMLAEQEAQSIDFIFNPTAEQRSLDGFYQYRSRVIEDMEPKKLEEMLVKVSEMSVREPLESIYASLITENPAFATEENKSTKATASWHLKAKFINAIVSTKAFPERDVSNLARKLGQSFILKFDDTANQGISISLHVRELFELCNLLNGKEKANMLSEQAAQIRLSLILGCKEAGSLKEVINTCFRTNVDGSRDRINTSNYGEIEAFFKEKLFPKGAIKAMYESARSTQERELLRDILQSPELSQYLSNADQRFIREMARDLKHNTTWFTKHTGWWGWTTRLADGLMRLGLSNKRNSYPKVEEHNDLTPILHDEIQEQDDENKHDDEELLFTAEELAAAETKMESEIAQAQQRRANSYANATQHLSDESGQDVIAQAAEWCDDVAQELNTDEIRGLPDSLMSTSPFPTPALFGAAAGHCQLADVDESKQPAYHYGAGVGSEVISPAVLAR